MKRLFKLGSLATDSKTGLKTIFCDVVKEEYETLEQPLGTDYQVPEGKEFLITNLIFYGDAAKTVVRILYGDNGVTGSAVPPTNPVYISPFHSSPSINVETEHEVFLKVPEFKYITIYSEIGGAGVQVQGLECTA